MVSPEVCAQCPMAHRVEALESESASHRKQLGDLTVSVALGNERYGYIQATLETVVTKVQYLCDKNGKRWEYAVKAAASAIIGVIVGYLASAILH